MHRSKAPSRQGRLLKLNRNSDIVHSTSLTNSFLREERNLDKKLQNLDTEKRLSLAKMDSEIKLYRKMNKNNIGKLEDNCDMSDVSEAGSDGDEDIHVGYKSSFYDVNFKSKTGQYAKGIISTSDANYSPSKHGSSSSIFTPLDCNKKVLPVAEMSKQFHHLCLRETHSGPSRIETFFSQRSRDIPQYFETKKSDGTTRPRSASETQTQKAKEFEDFNPRNRSTSIRHADHTGFPHSENKIGGLPHYTDGHQATGLGGQQTNGLSHSMSGYCQAIGLSHNTADHQTTGLFHYMGGQQARGLVPQMEGRRHTAELPHDMGSRHTTGSFDQGTRMSRFNSPTSGLSHHMGSRHTTGSFHQATRMSSQFNNPTSGLSHLTNGIPTTIGGEHKSIVRIRNLVHAEHHRGEPGNHKPDEINFAGEAQVVGMHSHEPHVKTNKIPNSSVSKFKSSILGSKSLEKSDTSAIPAHASHTTSFQGPHLRRNSISTYAHGLPKQQSNAMHSTYDWVFQNSPPKHLGISIHNPMLFHPRFHNNLGLVDAPEEHTESTDPNSIHVLSKCRYLRIPKPLCHDPGVDHAWCT